MRISTERPAGLLGLLYHRPGSDEQRLIAEEADALAAYHARPASEDIRRAEAAANDHRSYLSNVWIPRHPVRAAVESWLQTRADRREAEKRQRAAPEPGHIGLDERDEYLERHRPSGGMGKDRAGQHGTGLYRASAESPVRQRMDRQRPPDREAARARQVEQPEREAGC
jgi:hypothetical protein